MIMKNTLFAFSIILVIFSLVSCGSGSSSKTDETTTDTVEVRKASADRILPEAVDPAKPIEASKIFNSFYEWTGTKVLVAGFIDTFTDWEKTGTTLYLIESPDSMNTLFVCEFKNRVNKEIKSSDIVIIRGTMAESSYWGFVIKDCELVELNGKYKKGQNPDPYTLQTEVYWVKDLYKACDKWTGTEVTVVGHYNSTTTSTMNDNTTWRIDLDNPETGQKLIGCTMQSEPDSDKLAKNRDNVKIRGKVSRDKWGTVQLVECVVVE
jgi:hypothetical protein